MITKMVIPKSDKIKFHLFADENDHSQNINYKVVVKTVNSISLHGSLMINMYLS